MVEAAGACLLRRGAQLDQQKRLTEALACYQEGLQLLMDTVKGETNAERKAILRTKIVEFMGRAEQIKDIIREQKERGIYHEQIHIENDSTGHSYKTLFGRFLDSDVTTIKVEDPYVRSFHQCQNFLRVCEMAVVSCDCLKNIELVTGMENHQQIEWFDMLKENLQKRNVNFSITFSKTLHDRQIILSSGWVIKIGRGLDIYKPPENKFSLGVYDLELRHCHETSVDIFHSKDVKTVK